MERRVLIAIFLSFLVLYVYQALVVKPVPKPAPGASPPASQTAATGAPTAADKPVAPPTRPSDQRPSPAPPNATPLVGDAAERDIRVETADVIAVFTNRG